MPLPLNFQAVHMKFVAAVNRSQALSLYHGWTGG
jgi:hypothetical protein